MNSITNALNIPLLFSPGISHRPLALLSWLPASGVRRRLSSLSLQERSSVFELQKIKNKWKSCMSCISKQKPQRMIMTAQHTSRLHCSACLTLCRYSVYASAFTNMPRAEQVTGWWCQLCLNSDCTDTHTSTHTHTGKMGEGGDWGGFAAMGGTLTTT